MPHPCISQDSKVNTMTRIQAGWSGVQIPAGPTHFHLSKVPRPALGTAQAPIQRVPVVLSSECSGHDARMITCHQAPS
jgi:hypothetical protein